MPIDNALTRLLGIATPIVLGPMANAAGGELAAATSLGGGLGFLGAGYWTPSTLQDHLSTARATMDNDGALAGTGAGRRLPLGVGFLVWRLTKAHGAPLATTLATSSHPGPEGQHSDAIELVETALRARPKAIWLSFGEPDELVALADFIRARDAQLAAELTSSDDVDDPLVLFVGVGNETQARHAVEQIGCDVLAVTGNEAGGHGLAASPSLFTLLPRVAHILPTLQPRTGIKTALSSQPNQDRRAPYLLGAGGLADGAGLAALLALGAHGAVFGTRYLLTPEAMYTPAQKDLLQSLGGRRRAEGQDPTEDKEGDALTLRTMAFDDARGTLDWPQGVDGRGVHNLTVATYEADPSPASREARQARYKQAEGEKDVRRLTTWAGTGVDVMDDIVPARELTARLTKEAEEALRAAHSQIA